MLSLVGYRSHIENQFKIRVCPNKKSVFVCFCVFLCFAEELCSLVFLFFHNVKETLGHVVCGTFWDRFC